MEPTSPVDFVTAAKLLTEVGLTGFVVVFILTQVKPAVERLEDRLTRAISETNRLATDAITEQSKINSEVARALGELTATIQAIQSQMLHDHDEPTRLPRRTRATGQH